MWFLGKWVHSWKEEFWICAHFYICSCVDELLCTKSGKEKRSFSWFLPLCRTWGGWSWSRWLLREVIVTIFEHHLGLGVRIAHGEKGCFGKRGKVFPGINSHPCCFCYLVFVFLLEVMVLLWLIPVSPIECCAVVKPCGLWPTIVTQNKSLGS